jgi:hypothetical protein
VKKEREKGSILYYKGTYGSLMIPPLVREMYRGEVWRELGYKCIGARFVDKDWREVWRELGQKCGENN